MHMNKSLSILLAILSSVFILSVSSETNPVNESTLSVEQIYMPPLTEETTLDAYAFPMTLLDDTVYYAVDYLKEQSNDVQRSEIYAMARGETPELLYEIDFPDGHGGISLLESAEGYLFWTEDGDPWSFRYMDLTSKDVYEIEPEAREGDTPSPSFQVVGDYLYWFELKDEAAQTRLHQFNYVTGERSVVQSEEPYYLDSPYSRIPASEKVLNYLTETDAGLCLHRLSEDGSLETFETNLYSISLTAVSDRHAFFADQSLEPRLYVLTRETGEIEEVLTDTKIKSIRSAVIIDDQVLIDMAVENKEGVFLWQIGDKDVKLIGDATAWLRRGSEEAVFGVIPDSEINRAESIAGMRVFRP